MVRTEELGFTVHGTLPAAPERVWRALADDADRHAWWPDVRRFETVAGGRFEERWSDGEREVITSGRVLDVEPGHRLRLSWADDDWRGTTTVTFELRPGEAPDTTELVIHHAGWERIPGGEALAHAHEDGWRAHLARLADHVRQRDRVP
jgi:uncharacterized protein YndB with AHSA1/START domain